ncbi:Smr/MutS family protein [Sphingobacterium sp. SRCM116780]|uniref:Smr/MutS family protein n=1 Tax=Sphingobacterium sp. SRCM116780 TaxID=2907623 RepID=UPI001F228D68|nr:Smr/MutS family protein [Sphingobacterium sp. SRCM116780]UIR54722.1 Smr/MutS family protein [Sphingobacterium sp. SRCM116780]
MKKPSEQIDLHAEAFLLDWENYSADELANESMIYMRDMLDAAIYWDMPEIKFVHGKGKGVLKKMVYDELSIYKNQGAISHYHPAYHNEDIVIVVIGF